MLRVGSKQLLRTIALALENHVLPELSGASWSASYVRSCLMLLAQLEARFGIEPEVLLEDNNELRALLAKAGVARPPVSRTPEDDYLISLQIENDELQQALNVVIEQAYDNAPDLLSQIHDDLTLYRLHALERDARLLGRALHMSPL